MYMYMGLIILRTLRWNKTVASSENVTIPTRDDVVVSEVPMRKPTMTSRTNSMTFSKFASPILVDASIAKMRSTRSLQSAKK